jgi:RimJ/RimL family protein N-acetyltransferase
MNERPNNPRMMSVREKLARMAPRRAIEILGPELLRTPRLVLRPLAETDRAEFIAAIRESRADLEPYFDLWQPGDSDGAVFERQMELTRRGTATGQSCRLGAFFDDGRFVGCLNLNDIDRAMELRGEASWWVRSNLAGMGLGTEGVRGLLEYAIGDRFGTGGSGGGLGLARVVAMLHPDNASSRRLAERVGMHIDPKAATTVRLHGAWVPHVVYCKSAGVAAGLPARSAVA